jgi:hypothetical protein
MFSTRVNKFKILSTYKKLEQIRKISYENNILLNSKISTEPNLDPSYKNIGMIHITDSRGINVIREIGTEIMNIFGNKGFDNQIYDELRNESLDKINNFVNSNPNYKISNLRMEFSHVNVNLLVHHVYGTLLEKKIKK